MVLDKLKGLPWWALILIGLFVVPFLLNFFRRVAA